MVVVGGGSDVKMGCTIYWKIFPVKSVRGVYISAVNQSINQFDSILLCKYDPILLVFSTCNKNKDNNNNK